jgi:hypothetical protein
MMIAGASISKLLQNKVKKCSGSDRKLFAAGFFAEVRKQVVNTSIMDPQRLDTLNAPSHVHLIPKPTTASQEIYFLA